MMAVVDTVLIMNFIYCFIITIIFSIRKKTKNVETFIYKTLIISTLLSTVLEISCGYLIQHAEKYYLLAIIVNKFHIANMCFWVTQLTIYIVTIAFGIKYFKDKYNNINLKMLILFVNILLTVIIFVLPLNFFNDGQYMYVTGVAPSLIMIIGLIYILIDIYSIIKNFNTINKKKLIPLAILVIGFVAVIILRNVDPGLVLMSVVFSLVTFVMYHTIENPDVKMIEELQVAREQAEKANRAKTDFLSSMSHEIRTPLNAIVGFSDCIMEAESLEDAKENAHDIINASQTLLEIVNGILDISKIEAGKIEIVNSSYNAYDTFVELAKLITPKMKEKGLDFSFNVAEDLPNTLYGDHTNLKKVITNLLSNACKYTDRGFVHYEVNCVNSKGVCKLIISVEDSGRGIKNENIDKMFTKFQRLDEDRNTTIEGTGLGLAITKQLIELMGGRIIVHTVYGEGSKFTVVVNQKIEKVEIKTEKKIKNSLDLKDVKILVVDDTELNLKVASKLLERYNANMIDLCDSGYSCLEKIKSGGEYDLILLDDMMPKMSGVETLRRLKEIPGFNIPTVALTANAISGMREKYLVDGFDDYLAKPIEKEQLIHVINQVLGRSITEKIEVLDINDGVENENNYLIDNGVNLDYALGLLGDIEMYNMTIKDFMSEVEDKWKRINDYKNAANMKDYSIEVHSLKSDCKYLGFMVLADIAYEHELKSKENDINFVNDNFLRLEEEYKKVLNIVRTYVKDNSL